MNERQMIRVIITLNVLRAPLKWITWINSLLIRLIKEAAQNSVILAEVSLSRRHTEAAGGNTTSGELFRSNQYYHA
jgi:hypothetical protein